MKKFQQVLLFFIVINGFAYKTVCGQAITPYALSFSPGIFGGLAASNEEVYTLGLFRDTLLSPLTFPVKGKPADRFNLPESYVLFKQARNGKVSWLKEGWCWGSVSKGYSSLAVSSNNFLYTGLYVSTKDTFHFDNLKIKIPGDTSGGNYPAATLLFKLDTSGAIIWHRKIVGRRPIDNLIIRSDESGNLLVAGYFFMGSLDFGGTVLSTTLASHDTQFFVAKYKDDGTFLWAQSFGGIEWEYIDDLHCDAQDNIYIGGSFFSPELQLGPFTLKGNPYLAKMDPNGQFKWATTMGPKAGPSRFYSITSYKDRIYAAGQYGGVAVEYADTSIQSPGTRGDYTVITCFDSNTGKALWLNQNTQFSNDAFASVFTKKIVIDTTEMRLYLAGDFNTPIARFGNYVLTNSDPKTMDIFVTKMTTNGKFESAFSIGGRNLEKANDLVLLNKDNLILSALFMSDSLQLPGGQVRTYTSSYENFFVTTLDKKLLLTNETSPDPAYYMQVYPNPAYSSVSMHASERVNYSFFSLQGQELSKGTFTGKYELNTAHFPRGVYVLKIQSIMNGSMQVKKIVLE